MRDAYSADFGVGFYGHWKNAGGYLTCTPSAGWLCVGCDISSTRPPAAAAQANAASCDEAAELRIALRDGFRRRLYLQPLGVMLTLDGAAFESTILRMKPAPRGAVLRIVPVPSTATHAMVTLRADGGADAPARRLRLRCSAPCGFEPQLLGGAAADTDEVVRVRLGSAGGANLEVSAE